VLGALISRSRALALAALGAALVVYGAGATHLWEFQEAWDVAVAGLLVFPTSTAAIWLALPLARTPRRHPAAFPAAAAAVALALALVGLEGAFNVAKLACFALLGFAVLWLLEELWWVVLLAVLVPWVDVWSVAAGPTRYVVEEVPGIIERLAVGYPFPGEETTVYLGPPDVIFFALFLAAADRFRLRVFWTWLAMTGFLALTLALVLRWDVAGLPALPAVCVGFLLPNVDRIWQDVRAARAART